MPYEYLTDSDLCEEMWTIRKTPVAQLCREGWDENDAIDYRVAAKRGPRVAASSNAGADPQNDGKDNAADKGEDNFEGEDGEFVSEDEVDEDDGM